MEEGEGVAGALDGLQRLEGEDAQNKCGKRDEDQARAAKTTCDVIAGHLSRFKPLHNCYGPFFQYVVPK